MFSSEIKVPPFVKLKTLNSHGFPLWENNGSESQPVEISFKVLIFLPNKNNPNKFSLEK